VLGVAEKKTDMKSSVSYLLASRSRTIARLREAVSSSFPESLEDKRHASKCLVIYKFAQSVEAYSPFTNMPVSIEGKWTVRFFQA
jgi:hypothetical protein